MKELPILFSPILAEANRRNFVKSSLQIKTQTRRVSGLQKVNRFPGEYDFIEYGFNPLKECVTAIFQHVSEGTIYQIDCPYGQPGDLLWVRENWKAFMSPFDPKWMVDYQSGGRFETEALFSDPVKEKAAEDKDLGKFWKPSIHMPKLAASQWSMVREIRIERLQDISENDAIREGIKWYYDTEDKNNGYYLYPQSKIKEEQSVFCDSYVSTEFLQNNGIFNFGTKSAPILSFQSLIKSIHGPKIWSHNPFVWVIDYYPISITGKPDEEALAMWKDYHTNIGAEWEKDTLIADITANKYGNKSTLAPQTV